MIAAHDFLESGEALSERTCLSIEVDEQPAVPDLGCEHGKGTCCGVEGRSFVHERSVHQGAVVSVRPQVIGTRESLRRAAAVGHPVAPVPADVRQHPHGAVGQSCDEELFSHDLRGDVVARHADLVLVPDAQPLSAKQFVLLHLQKRRRRVEGGGQRSRLVCRQIAEPGERGAQLVGIGGRGVVPHGLDCSGGCASAQDPRIRSGRERQRRPGDRVQRQ